MTAIVKNKFRLINAKNFKALFNSDINPETLKDNYYMFIGKSMPWHLDEYPDTPVDSLESDTDIWDNMLSVKRITDNDITLCIPRHDWKSGEVYTQYNSNDSDLTKHPLNEADKKSWYVLNSDFDLFICLSNNNGVESTVKPEYSTSSPIFETGDGYVWQYLTSLTTVQINNFLSNNWIPIKNTPDTDDYESNYTRRQNAKIYIQQNCTGMIASATVVNPGYNYINIMSGTAYADAGSSTIITQTTIFAPGFDGIASYLERSAIYIGDKKYTIASCALSGLNYVITTVEALPAEGIPANTQYIIGPNLNITGDGAGEIVCIPTIVDGSISNVRIVNNESNKDFTYANCEIIPGGTGGIGGSIKLNITPLNGLGVDIESDLNAYYVMCRTNLEYQVEDFPISNDYRQIGIIHNAFDNNNTMLVSDTACATQILEVLITELGPDADNDYNKAFLPDAQLISLQNNAKGYIVDYEYLGEDVLTDNNIDNVAHTAQISYIQNSTTGKLLFEEGQEISANGSKAKILSVIPSEIAHEKGDLLYFENRRPILRAPDQIEEIKTIIEF